MKEKHDCEGGGMYICRVGLDRKNWCRIREPKLRVGEGERRGKLEERGIIITQLRKLGQRGRFKWSGIGTGKG